MIYMVNDSYRCKLCNKRLHDYCISFRGWSRNESHQFLFCEQCIGEFRRKTPKMVVEFTNVVHFTDKIRPHCTIVASKPPVLKDSDLDVSVYEGEKIRSETTTDMTRIANRQTLEGATIGTSMIDRMQDAQIRNLKQLDKAFEQHMKSTPIIQDNLEDSKKLLEHNKNRKVQP